MRRWLTNLGYRIQSSMYGRYGMDEFSKFLLIFALVLMVISCIVHRVII